MSIRIGWHEFIAQPRRRGGRAACGARPITGAKPVIGFLYPGSPWFRGSFPHPRRGADSHSSAARLTATSDGPATSVRVLGEDGEGTPTVLIEGPIDRPPGHRVVTRVQQLWYMRTDCGRARTR